MNETNITIFEKEEFGKIRIVTVNGLPYFAGKDLVKVLGYTDLTHAVLDHVDEEDRINSKTQGCFDPEFGQRGTWLVNESGLYSLILGSKLESARIFKRWVTSEVLPEIRKTGSFIGTDARKKSKEVRNHFTNTLKEHGYSKPHEYIQTTVQMKKTLGISHKKEEMTAKELAMTVASEMLSFAMISDEYGFQEVNPVCLEASETVAGAIENKKKKNIA